MTTSAPLGAAGPITRTPALTSVTASPIASIRGLKSPAPPPTVHPNRREASGRSAQPSGRGNPRRCLQQPADPGDRGAGGCCPPGSAASEEPFLPPPTWSASRARLEALGAEPLLQGGIEGRHRGLSDREAE